jgi:hypothetical protein
MGCPSAGVCTLADALTCIPCHLHPLQPLRLHPLRPLHPRPPTARTEAPTKAFINAGTRVCIGGTDNDWFGGGGGVAGVAYLNSFGYSGWGAGPGTTNEVAPCFVFADTLYDHPVYLWKVINHEVGHTFGL